MTSPPDDRKAVRAMPCLLCGRLGCDPHHMIRKSKCGADSADNLVPLCRECHTKFHNGNREVIEQCWVNAEHHWEYLRRCGILKE